VSHSITAYDAHLTSQPSRSNLSLSLGLIGKQKTPAPTCAHQTQREANASTAQAAASENRYHCVLPQIAPMWAFQGFLSTPEETSQTKSFTTTRDSGEDGLTLCFRHQLAKHTLSTAFCRGVPLMPFSSVLFSGWLVHGSVPTVASSRPSWRSSCQASAVFVFHTSPLSCRQGNVGCGNKYNNNGYISYSKTAVGYYVAAVGLCRGVILDLP